MREKKKRKSKKVDRFTEDGRRIVSLRESKQKFIQRLLGKNPINWPREMKIANALYENYSSDFLHFYVLPFDIPSLAYFVSKDGKKNLDLNYKVWQYGTNKPDQEVFEPCYTKIELKKVTARPKNIFSL